MDKPKLHSPDLTQSNIERLAELFPGCVTEARDDNGTLKKAIDFDQLRQELSDHIVEGPQERYHLNWPGKREALLAANAPIAKTLRPCREESVDFDTTKNLFIEGDNLDALKLLQETYLNSVKMIYIDPPYNTGKEFIYSDDYVDVAANYLAKSNQSDDAGNCMAVNTESNGRFHSDWLSMIYPRLKFARNMLREDGVIFISIGEQEIANLRKICDEIFGEDNFISNIIWQSRTSISNDQPISLNHNHTLVYCRAISALAFGGEPLDSSEYSNTDGDSRGPWKSVPIDANKPGGETVYPIRNPNTGEDYFPPNGRSWAFNEREYRRLVEDDRIIFGKNGNAAPKKKLFLKERLEKGDIKTPSSLLRNDVGTTKNGTSETMSLFSGKKVFSYPKPVSFISKLLSYSGVGGNDTVMDFFAGSCTTPHAVMEHNAKNNNSLKYVVVQMAEPFVGDTEAEKNCRELGFEDIAQVARERIIRAGNSVAATFPVEDVDMGFRVLKIDTSNMQDVYYTPDAITQDDLYGQVDNIKPDRSGEDLLFQVMLDWGLDLALPISVETIAGKTVYFVDGDDLAACFETGIDEAFVKELAQRKPLRAVFRDTGYGSDNAKINVAQIFRLISPNTDVKSI